MLLVICIQTNKHSDERNLMKFLVDFPLGIEVVSDEILLL